MKLILDLNIITFEIFYPLLNVLLEKLNQIRKAGQTCTLKLLNL